MRSLVVALLYAFTTSAFAASTVSQPCNQVVPECNGEWTCPAPVTPSYDPRYGMICYSENGVESFSVGLTQMCPLGGNIIDGSCQVITPATSIGCPDQTEPIIVDGVNSCVIKYPIFCPPGFVYFREYQTCKPFITAQCVNKTECGYYCYDGLVPVHLTSASDDYPVCLYSKKPATPVADGQLGCTPPEVLMNGDCLGYYDALYNDCGQNSSIALTVTATQTAKPSPEPSKDAPSASPEPSRDAPSASPEPSRDAPSASPEPSKEQPTQTAKPEEPSRSPEPSRDAPLPSQEPCNQRWCTAPLALAADGLCYDKQSASGYPQCEQVSHAFMPSLNRCAEWTMAPFTGPSDCPPGFEVLTIQDMPMCIRLYDPVWQPCPPEYNLIQTISGERVCERMTVPKCGCPVPGNYSGCRDHDFYDSAEGMCYNWYPFTKEMRQCPQPYILVPRNDKLFCALPYEPIETVCPPGFTVVIRPDGTKICQTVEGEPCDSSTAPTSVTATATQTSKPEEPSSTPTMTPHPEEQPTETATQTAKPEEPSSTPTMTPHPQEPSSTATQTAKPEEPSSSPRPSMDKPSETPSPTPVKVPIISATIRIEISATLAQNTTSDLSVFQEPAVLMSLKDAIARALGVPPEMVEIESVAWIDNGVVMSTVQIRNATGARLLQAADNYDIKYKVVNPPAELLALAPEEFATRVEASTTVLGAAAAAVSAATGVPISTSDIVVQSTEMAMALPQSQAAPQANSLPIAAIAGGAGGGFVLIGAAIAVGIVVYYKKKRAPGQVTSRVAPTQFPAETTFKTDRIVVMNPMVAGPNGEQRFVVQNKNFSFAYSSRDLESAFTPRQARRGV